MTQNKRRSHLRRRSNPKKNKFKITMRMSGKMMIKRAEKMRS
jgi:phage protein U